MASDLGYPVYDADNHLYEPEEAMTAHLPKKWQREFQYVEVRGRKKLAIGGQISDYIPNPTFEVLAAPGTHELWYRAQNHEGLSLRELSGTPIACPEAYRNGEARLKLLDEQGVHATLIFPTLASAVEERMNYDHELMNAVLHSLNQWMFDSWGFAREERLFAVPFVTLMDVDMAVAELEWALERGARTVGLRPAPVPGYRGSRSPGFEEFDPFWARVNEAGIFVSLHASDSGYDRFARMWQGGSEFLPFEPDPFRMTLGLADRAIRDSISALICHGVFDRHPNVIEKHVVDLAATIHGGDRSHLYARAGHVDEQERDASLRFALGRGAHQAEHHVGVLGEGGPGLGAVDDIMVAVALGPRLERSEVGTRTRFGIALAPPVLAGQDARQIALLLRLAAEGDDHRADHGDAERNDPWRPGPRHLLVEDMPLHRRPAGATMFDRPAGCQPAAIVNDLLPSDIIVLAKTEPHLDLVPDLRRQVVAHERPHLVAERFVFGAQL